MAEILPANERDFLDGDDTALGPMPEETPQAQAPVKNKELEGDYSEQLAQAALGGLRKLGGLYSEYIEQPSEKYFKAPIRAGLKAGMEAPMGRGGEEFVAGAISQLRKEPVEAPTSLQVAEQAGLGTKQFETPIKTFTGVPYKTSAAEIGATGLDIATDPVALATAVIPGDALVTGAVKAGQFAAKPIGALGRGLEKTAASRAIRQATGRNKPQIQSYLSTSARSPQPVPVLEQRLLEMGTRIRNEPGLMGSLSSAESIGQRVPQAVRKYTNEMGRIGNAIDATGVWGVDMKAVADEIIKMGAELPNVQQFEALKRTMYDHAKKLEDMGMVSFKTAQEVKNSYKYKPREVDAVLNNQGLTNDINMMIARQMEDTVDQIDQYNAAMKAAGEPTNIDDNLLKSWREAKKGFAAMKETQRATSKEFIKDLSLRTISPSTYISGLPMLAAIPSMDLAQILVAAGIPVVNHLGLKYGNAFIAKNAGRVADIIRKSGQVGEKYKRVFGQVVVRGPQAVMATHYGLRELDPEYRELTNELRIEE